METNGRIESPFPLKDGKEEKEQDMLIWKETQCVVHLVTML